VAWEGTTAMAGDFHSGLQRHAVLEKLHRSKSTKAGLYMELNRREMKTLKDFKNNTCKKIKCLFYTDRLCSVCKWPRGDPTGEWISQQIVNHV
jgi:hypothetical protein